MPALPSGRHWSGAKPGPHFRDQLRIVAAAGPVDPPRHRPTQRNHVSFQRVAVIRAGSRRTGSVARDPDRTLRAQAWRPQIRPAKSLQRSLDRRARFGSRRRDRISGQLARCFRRVPEDRHCRPPPDHSAFRVRRPARCTRNIGSKPDSLNGSNKIATIKIQQFIHHNSKLIIRIVTVMILTIFCIP
jgi:hypothetical protein